MKRAFQGIIIALAVVSVLAVAAAASMVPGLVASNRAASEVCTSYAALAIRRDFARAAELSLHDAKHAERVADALEHHGRDLHITGYTEHSARDRDYEVIEGTLESGIGIGTGTAFACFAEKRGASWRIAAWVIAGEIL